MLQLQIPNSPLQTNVPANTGVRRPAASGGTSDSAEPSTPERFQSGETRPEWMELGRKRWNGNSTLISTNAAPPSKIQKAMADPKVKATLAKFSPQLQQQVSALSDAQLKVLKGGMSGTTDIGITTIDNRKAFIKGSVALKSIWGNVKQSITDARTKYNMINAPEEKALHKLIDSVSPLKPEQRKQLAELMDSVR